MKTLKQHLQDQPVLLSALQKQKWVSPEEALIDVYDAVKLWLEQKPSDYTVTYVPESGQQPTEYLAKKKLLEEL